MTELDEALSQCARCHCSVPVDEWTYIRPQSTPLGAFKHTGPMRDHHIDKYVEPNERGETACNWIKPVPEKIQP